MEDTFFNIISTRLLASLVTVVAGVVLYMVLAHFLDRKIKSLPLTQKNKKRITYLNLSRNIVRYVVLIVAAFVILSIYGIDVSSLLAGLGIASVIAGLALQDALKDIIAGFNILVDEYYAVGDFIKIDDIEGEVIEIGLKITRLRDLSHGDTLTIANRNFVKALKISKQLDLDIPIPYEESLAHVEEVMQAVVQEIQESNPKIEQVEYRGLQEFAKSAIVYKIRLMVSPDIRLQVRRDSLRIIKLKLDQEHITIPYPQLDVHNKK